MSPIRRRLDAYVRLGRVSNLPTVWTDVAAGAALATWGAGPAPLGALAALAGILSAFYVGGMFLNDAYDARIDARERPERPIPSGVVTAEHVERLGFALLAAGVLALAAWFGLEAALAGGALAAAVVVYDLRHKGNPLAPLVMGACRALVLVVAALAVAGRLGPAVVVGASLLLVYVTALTFVARRAGGRVVGAMIAGIAILDAALVALAWSPAAGLVVALGFPLTLRLQRRVSGT
jgi:4-hydroxybenzoate polyprenyltransferase